MGEHTSFDDLVIEIYCKNSNKKDVDLFIAEHEYINYCEAIIYTDGKVGYAEPGHVYALIFETGKSQDEINSLMPVWEIPITWLTNYTKCVPVWNVGYMEPECGMNDKQKESLNKLISAGFIIDKQI